MKLYFTFIKNFQEFLLAISIVILACLPASLVFVPNWFDGEKLTLLYALAHFSLFLVMLIRPLADIFRGVTWLRPLVILRKGMGVFSASIIVSFILSKLIVGSSGYFNSMVSADYWSFSNLAILAHLADISAMLLLITSNNLSKQLLGKMWKNIQRLSYVYFYGSGLYVFFILHDNFLLIYLVLVTLFTVLAWLRNHNFILQTNNPQTI
ncbi:hypothetical protein H6784_06000 [Candidatus Nomurabacteria bacterium]|nr:hypothetical protein [Candidatus Kaiserbacteria bacterium]MCB9811064.1 hypothetical protein [Candidatus Nomurabacteria bacterium]MCB9814924.1 hypothetical protein [Candidatus Nomurabacteria bacterium]